MPRVTGFAAGEKPNTIRRASRREAAKKEESCIDCINFRCHCKPIRVLQNAPEQCSNFNVKGGCQIPSEAREV